MSIRVAAIGGSFNPPTRGHGTIATEILRLGLADEAWFIPSYKHPFANMLDHKAKRATFEERCMLVNKLCEDLVKSDPSLKGKLKTNYVELLIRGECYTKLVIETLRERNKGLEFMWVVGTDCVNDFPKWKHIEWLLDNVTMIVYPREGYPYTGGLGKRHIILDPSKVKSTPGSSSQVRKEGSGSDLLTPGVAGFWKSLEKR